MHGSPLKNEANPLLNRYPPRLLSCPPDVVKTRVQAAQAEAVSAASSSRVGGSGGYQEPCDKCLQQGRTFTTSARAPSVAIAGYDATLNAAASVVTPRERPPALPSGTVAALHHIGRYEGPRGLYRGLDVSLIMAIPATVLYYTVYDDLLARLEKSGANNVVAPVTSGASARIIATLCLAPLELVRTRIQSEKSAVIEEVAVRPPGRGVKRARVLANFPLITVGKAVAKIFQEEGAAALWRGVGTTMWRDVPFSMVYWLGYENLKTGLGCGRRNSDSDRGARVEGAEISRPAEEKGAADFLLRSFTAGAVSGAVASLLTHPFDVVKTQQQVVLKTLNGECPTL